MAHHLEIGKLGEDIASRFLEERGYKIIEKNYWKKWGEIDIVAKKNNVLRFVEVKTVSREILSDDVTHETSRKTDDFKPEDAVTPYKIKRMRRVIQTYLAEKHVSPETSWQFDIMAISLDIKTKRARVKFIEMVVI